VNNLGATVAGQSRTSPTRSRNSSLADLTDEDFVLCEIGGTVGDIESLPFLEAHSSARQRARPRAG